jgi:hypothetical protein
MYFPHDIDPPRLDEHYRKCVAARGHMHFLRCAIQAINALLAPRFFLTVVLILLSIACLMWLV